MLSLKMIYFDLFIFITRLKLATPAVISDFQYYPGSMFGVIENPAKDYKFFCCQVFKLFLIGSGSSRWNWSESIFFIRAEDDHKKKQ